MALKSTIIESAAVVKYQVAEFYDVFANDPELLRRGGVAFPHHSIHANVDPIFELLGKSENEHLLTGDHATHVADIGVGDGGLSLMLSRCGYKVTSIDYSDQYNQAPYIVSQSALRLGLPIAVVDLSVDRFFTMDDLKANCIYNESDCLPANLQKFDFSICVGLLYHLKNPYAFVESLAKITRSCILGTWTFSHLPPQLTDVGGASLAYLLDDAELNGDPSNYWILSDAAVARLCRRCGFEVLDRLLIANNPRGIGTPNQMELLMRGFYLLHSRV